MDFADLPQALTLGNDPGGVITSYLGPWHGLSVHGFHGVWAAPNASLIIPNTQRYVTCETSFICEKKIAGIKN